MGLFTNSWIHYAGVVAEHILLLSMLCASVLAGFAFIFDLFLSRVVVGGVLVELIWSVLEIGSWKPKLLRWWLLLMAGWGWGPVLSYNLGMRLDNPGVCVDLLPYMSLLYVVCIGTTCRGVKFEAGLNFVSLCHYDITICINLVGRERFGDSR